MGGIQTDKYLLGVQPGTQRITTNSVVVGTGATLIAAARVDRRRILISVPSGGLDVFVGDANVTTSNGLRAFAGQRLTLETTDAVYGRVTSATVTVACLEEYGYTI